MALVISGKAVKTQLFYLLTYFLRIYLKSFIQYGLIFFLQKSKISLYPFELAKKHWDFQVSIRHNVYNLLLVKEKSCIVNKLF